MSALGKGLAESEVLVGVGRRPESWVIEEKFRVGAENCELKHCCKYPEA